MVVIPEEAPEDEEPETLIEISTGPPAGEPVVSCPHSHVGCRGGVWLPPSAPSCSWPGGPRGVRVGVTVLCYGRWWLTSLSRRLDPPMAQ